MDAKPKYHLNPYLAGFLLGLVLLASLAITGRGLGASGSMKDVVVTTVGNVAPEYAKNSVIFGEYFSAEASPMRSWLVFLTLGVIIGGLVSGIAGNRMGLNMERGPRLKPYSRAVFALAGGLLFGLGTQFGRGCTSGAALSGMAVLSTGGILTMMAIFGTGYLIAWFFRKLWI